MGQSTNKALDIKYPRYERIYNLQQSLNANVDIMRTKTWNISPCATHYYKTAQISQNLIIGRKIIAYQSSENQNTWTGTTPGKCHYYGQIYRFNEGFVALPEGISATGQQVYDSNLQNTSSKLSSAEITFDQIQNEIDAGKILLAEDDPFSSLQAEKKSSAQGSSDSKGLTPSDKPQIGCDVGQKWTSEAKESLYLKDLLQDSQSYVGVMTTLYSQLLTAGERSIVSYEGKHTESYISLLNTLLNLGYILALVAPLLALAIVLVLRIVILWILIAVSPIRVVLLIFKKEQWMGKSLQEYFSLAEIFNLLLAPVLITFAVSMSTVFIFCLQGINATQLLPENKLFLGMFSLTISGGTIYASKIVINMIGIAIVWTLLFWAIKSSKL